MRNLSTKMIAVALLLALVGYGGAAAYAQDGKPGGADAVNNPDSPNTITLPDSGSTNTAGHAWTIINSGVGRAGFFYLTHAGSTSPALEGRTLSTAAGASGVTGRVMPDNAGSASAGVSGLNMGTSGATRGVYGEARSPVGFGGYFLNSTTSGGVGAYGQSNSNTGVGVKGVNTSQLGWGVYGENNANHIGARGVVGISNVGQGVTGLSASGYGGHFASSSGVGVYGSTSGATGRGVHGVSTNATGWAVLGVNDVNSSEARGVVGFSAYGRAVAGVSSSGYGGHFVSSSSHGVYGESNSGRAVWGKSNYVGVWGESAGTSGVGLRGEANNGQFAKGVWGSSSGGYGVFGQSTSGYGVFGESSNSYGVLGRSSHTGVRAESNGTNSTAIDALATGSNTVGIRAQGSAWAGFFYGNVTVTGSCGGCLRGTYTVDHPADPANKLLNYASVTSTEQKNIIDGNVTTDGKGEATITLPKYFVDYNGDFRYQLTVVNGFGFASVTREAANGSFAIKSDKPNTKVSWQISAVRSDPAARANPVVVEAAKPAEQRGTYRNPELYGQPAAKGFMALPADAPIK